MNDENNNSSYIDGDLADVITGRPHGFCVGERAFRVFPITLGKMLELRPLIEVSGMESIVKCKNPYLSMLRLVREKRELCATILAIHTLENSRQGLHDREAVKWRTDFFCSEIDDEDMASLLTTVLTSDRTADIASCLGIDKELEKMSEAMRFKKQNRNSLSFGGKSIFGSFIAPLKEMGFSVDEIVFECGYSFLRLILMDRQVSVYMSDDELDLLGGSAGALIDSEDADADRQLEAFFASKGVDIK